MFSVHIAPEEFKKTTITGFFLICVLGSVHKSHFCHVKFNSIKCGRNVTVDSEVPLVSHLIHNRYCRVCWSAENVLNTEYSIWRINILSDKGLKFGQNLSANGTRRRLTMQHVLQYVKVELRQKWCIQIYA